MSGAASNTSANFSTIRADNLYTTGTIKAPAIRVQELQLTEARDVTVAAGGAGTTTVDLTTGTIGALTQRVLRMSVDFSGNNIAASGQHVINISVGGQGFTADDFVIPTGQGVFSAVAELGATIMASFPNPNTLRVRITNHDAVNAINTATAVFNLIIFRTQA